MLGLPSERKRLCLMLKRALELLLKGERVGRYILKNYQYDTQTIWYVHGAVAFRPHMDFINPKCCRMMTLTKSFSPCAQR